MCTLNCYHKYSCIIIWCWFSFQVLILCILPCVMYTQYFTTLYTNSSSFVLIYWEERKLQELTYIWLLGFCLTSWYFEEAIKRGCKTRYVFRIYVSYWPSHTLVEWMWRLKCMVKSMRVSITYPLIILLLNCQHILQMNGTYILPDVWDYRSELCSRCSLYYYLKRRKVFCHKQTISEGKNS